MRNQKLHNLGLWLILFGSAITSWGVYKGVATKFHSTLAEQSSLIMMGAVPLGIGILLWLLFEE